MILYLLIIFLAFFTTAFLASIFLGFGEALLSTAYVTGTIVAVDAVVALLTRAFPERKINPFGKYFTVGKKERKFYEQIGVRKFKDVIPETGKYLCHFAKDKIERPNDNEYLLKFLKETCYAEVMHFLSVFLGFLPLSLFPKRWAIALVLSTVNALLQILPVIVQRYNRCRLTIAYRFNERKRKGQLYETEKNTL